jgi:hypothetical protein
MMFVPNQMNPRESRTIRLTRLPEAIGGGVGLDRQSFRSELGLRAEVSIARNPEEAGQRITANAGRFTAASS